MFNKIVVSSHSVTDCNGGLLIKIIFSTIFETEIPRHSAKGFTKGGLEPYVYRWWLWEGAVPPFYSGVGREGKLITLS